MEINLDLLIENYSIEPNMQIKGDFDFISAL